jgi:hypothetical protein
LLKYACAIGSRHRHVAMGRIEKTVFISHSRTDEPWALAVFGDLTQHGYDVFIDYDGIANGNFETAILDNIRARAHFLVLLTPTALERSGAPEDWIRREIEAALDSRRNIVPLMLEGFDFGTPAIANQLTGKLSALRQYNGLPIPKGYFSPAMGRLRNGFLNVPVDAVLHSASVSAQQAATEQKAKAAIALALADEQRKREDEQKAAQAEAARQAREQKERRQQEAEAQPRVENEAQAAAEQKAEAQAEAERQAQHVEASRFGLVTHLCSALSWSVRSAFGSLFIHRRRHRLRQRLRPRNHRPHLFSLPPAARYRCRRIASGRSS